MTLEAVYVTGKEHKKLNKVNLNQHKNHEALKEKGVQTFLYHRKREQKKENVTKHFFFLGLLNLVDKDRIEDI